MIAEKLLGQPTTATSLLAEFLLSSIIVFLLARKLSKWADALERLKVISGVVIGMIFLAIVTSLPEAVASIGSAMMEGAIDLGIGNLFGSNTFNLLLVVMLDAMNGRVATFEKINRNLAAPALGGAVMMIVIMAGTLVLTMSEAAAWAPAGSIAVSCLIFFGYFYLTRKTGTDLPSAHEVEHIPPTSDKKTIVTRLILYAAALVLAAMWLLRVCDAIAVFPFHVGGRELILGRTVTGTFILSLATSFPELFVTVAAFRLGQVDMAFANVLGSNMANMWFVPMMHLASGEGLFYGLFNPYSLIVLITATAMSLLFVVGVRTRSTSGVGCFSWVSLAMLAAYVVGAYIFLKLGMG